MNEISIYQTEIGAFEVRLEQDTVWLMQAQMVTLFGRDQSVVSRHIGNIFKEGELERESNMQKMHIANSDKLVELYMARNDVATVSKMDAVPTEKKECAKFAHSSTDCGNYRGFLGSSAGRQAAGTAPDQAP